MNKENGIYTHNGLLIRRKNETMACLGTGKKVEMIIASEVRETGSDRYDTDDLSKHPSGGHRKRTQNSVCYQFIFSASGEEHSLFSTPSSALIVC